MSDRICAYAPCTVSLSGRRSNVTACTENHKKLASKARMAAAKKAAAGKRFCSWCGAPISGRSDRKACTGKHGERLLAVARMDGPAGWRPGSRRNADEMTILDSLGKDSFAVVPNFTKDHRYDNLALASGWNGLPPEKKIREILAGLEQSSPVELHAAVVRILNDEAEQDNEDAKKLKNAKPKRKPLTADAKATLFILICSWLQGFELDQSDTAALDVGWTGHNTSDGAAEVAPAIGSDLAYDGSADMARLRARQAAFVPKYIRDLPEPYPFVSDGPLSSVELDGLQVIFPSLAWAPRLALELAAETLSPKERQELRIQMKDDAERSAVKAEQTADLKAACLKWIDEDEWNAVAPNHQAAKWLAFERFHYAHNRKVRAFKKALAQSRLELAC